MAKETTEGLSPTEAIETLTEIEGYDKTLTVRTFGLTLMVFALAIGAIPISYASAESWLSGHAYAGVIESLLWAPWIGGAVTITSVLWKTHSISLGESDAPVYNWLGVAFTIVFFLMAFGVQIIVGSTMNVYITWGITAGLFTVLLGGWYYYLYRKRWALIPLIVAGVVILLGNLLLSTVELHAVQAGFATGFLQGCVYFLTGLAISMRG
ncbi:hypothetical protein [Halocatena halophila]|uniref:hypothetical protein n=1 Tax=Halocatena halophila TaxID=2814576 RepID=UPI002ED2FF60